MISITSGFKYKKGSPASVEINNKIFDIYTEDSTAWARDNSSAVNAMLKSKEMFVRGVPVKGQQVLDFYSLDGFQKALSEMGHGCLAGMIRSNNN